MRKIAGLLSIFVVISAAVVAQDPAQATEPKQKKKKQDKTPQVVLKSPDSKVEKTKPDYTKLNLKERANDHFLIQYGYDNWAGAPDSIQINGFCRHFNMYVMYDKPFQTNPRWSVGIGAGVSSSNMFFEKTKIHLVNNRTAQGAVFENVADTNHFEKYKLANVWLEAPIELRWAANPANTNKSFKVALGMKIGTMVAGYTKGKQLQDKNDNAIYGSKYIMKEKEKSYFNSTRFSAIMRVGYSFFSVSGAYQITSLFKEGLGPDVRPYSIGITISGL
jgi:hypothetical protein